MIIWTIKLVKTARRAVAGRKYPHQLAWGVAFGFLLGVVPHGNLLALGILLVVLSLKLNHAMAGLTAVATTFAATWFDPFSHQLGERVLSDQRVTDVAVRAWQLPLVPWTDLNNTVVMGSFLLGVGLLVPIFVVTYPLFRLFAPPVEMEPEPKDAAENKQEPERSSHQIILVDQSHSTVVAPHRQAPEPAVDSQTAVASEASATQHVDHQPAAATDTSAANADIEGFDARLENALAEQDDDDFDQQSKDVAVETRIDVIRMKDYRETKAARATDQGSEAPAAPEETADGNQQPMDEALNYLLRQLRDSQQRKVA